MLQTYNLSNFYIPESFINTHFREKNSYPQMQILKYMGNKRGLLNWLVPILREQLNEGDSILDLFAGTSSVGYALKDKNKIIANDIQKYSSVISSALLEFNDRINENDFRDNLLTPYKKNYSTLLNNLSDALKDEREVIKNNDILRYHGYIKNLSRYGEIVKSDKYNQNYYCTEEFIKKRRRKPSDFPYILFSAYYPNTFFSLEQCIEIDSLRYAIDLINNKSKKAVYLSCLMYAISKAVNSSGHFAEYLNHNSSKSSNEILEQRRVSILKNFLFKLSKFRSITIQTKWKNEVYNLDWRESILRLSKKNRLKDVKLIYIDPPYTTAQYSRFYHIPETLVRYDYPQITIDKTTEKPVKGRYRNDRIQSRFSQITKAEQEFEEMFKLLSSKSRATIAISYSDNSILKPIDTLIKIAEKYYMVSNIKNGYIHSAQGSKFTSNGKGNREIHEYLLICKPKS